MASSPNTDLGAQVSSGEKYRNEFDTQAFLQYYDRLTEYQAQPLRLLHEFYHSYGSTSCLKVLDYGAGPTVLYSISAALQASEIVLSDYTEQNRAALQHWLKDAPEAHDWTPFFKYVVQSLEGLGEEEVAKRQEDVRTRIKAVVNCDIHMDPPIQSGYEGPYDVIFSSLCLENACTSCAEYEVALTKLCTLLKPGGKIVLRDIEAGEDEAPTNYYIVGAQKFVSLNVTESLIRSTLEKAGFYNITFKRQLRDSPGVNIPREASDYYAMSFITATKKY